MLEQFLGNETLNVAWSNSSAYASAVLNSTPAFMCI